MRGEVLEVLSYADSCGDGLMPLALRSREQSRIQLTFNSTNFERDVLGDWLRADEQLENRELKPRAFPVKKRSRS